MLLAENQSQRWVKGSSLRVFIILFGGKFMKNKLFRRCIYLCIFGGFLVNLRLIPILLDLETSEVFLDNGFGTLLMSMGNKMRNSLIPGMAAGFAGLIMSLQLRLWQGCLLCLLLPFFDVLFQYIFLPVLGMIFMSKCISINLTALVFNYTVIQSYSFPIFFVSLNFYGILLIDKVIILLCTIWNIGWYFLLYLIPPMFPQFDYDQMIMDNGEITRRLMLYGMSYLAVALLLFFILYDIKKLKCWSQKLL